MNKLNKNGDVAITLLVIMTLVLVGTTLFIFLTRSASFEAFIADARFVEGAYIKEAKADFYLQKSAENAFARSYDDLSTGFKLTGFNDAAMKSLMKSTFLTSFREGMLAYTGNDEDISSLNELVKKESFGVDLKDNYLNLSMKDFVIRTSYMKKESKRVWVWKIIPTWIKEEEIKSLIGVSYRPKISAEINFTRFGLADFNMIHAAAIKCNGLKESEQKRACLAGELPMFDVSVSEQKGKFAVELSTKRAFLIGKEVRKIELSFAM